MAHVVRGVGVQELVHPAGLRDDGLPAGPAAVPVVQAPQGDGDGLELLEVAGADTLRDRGPGLARGGPAQGGGPALHADGDLGGVREQGADLVEVLLALGGVARRWH